MSFYLPELAQMPVRVGDAIEHKLMQVPYFPDAVKLGISLLQLFGYIPESELLSEIPIGFRNKFCSLVSHQQKSILSIFPGAEPSGGLYIPCGFSRDSISGVGKEPFVIPLDLFHILRTGRSSRNQ